MWYDATAMVSTIESKADLNLRSQIQAVFRRAGAQYELRSVSEGELVYEVRLPFKRRTDKLSTAIVALDKHGWLLLSLH